MHDELMYATKGTDEALASVAPSVLELVLPTHSLVAYVYKT